MAPGSMVLVPGHCNGDNGAGVPGAANEFSFSRIVIVASSSSLLYSHGLLDNYPTLARP